MRKSNGYEEEEYREESYLERCQRRDEEEYRLKYEEKQRIEYDVEHEEERRIMDYNNKCISQREY